MEKRKSVILLAALAMLFAAAGAFTQEATPDFWCYGIEASLGVTPGDGLLDSYSFSIQGIHDTGLGLSLDWIHKEGKYEGHVGTLGTGLLGSAFLGFLIGDFFIPYIGGGLGIEYTGTGISFAWKVDAGAAVRPSDVWYVKAGAMYDNVREDLGISVGVGIRLKKTVTATYRGWGERTFTKYLWQDNSTPDSIYDDEFVSKEVVNRYRKTTTSSYYSPAQYETRSSGGETVTTTLKDRSGKTIGTATSTTDRTWEQVKTKDATTTTYYYVYDVTVTRNWYTRTYYYQDRSPATAKVYQDVESAVLVDRYSRTEAR
jgi:hypothetical protein